MRGGRSWAEIDFGALDRNLELVRARIPSGAGVMAVVKANAYGHGIGSVARHLAGRVEMFGVANLEEARQVARVGGGTPVLLLGAALPEEREGVVAGGFIPCVSGFEEAAAYGRLADAGRPVEIHVVIDTGMGRMGVWEGEASEVLRRIDAVDGIRVTGLSTHLPVADTDDGFTAEQLGRFSGLCGGAGGSGGAGRLDHVLNSAGILGHGAGAGAMVRPGLMLYGVRPSPRWAGQLHPVMTWKTRVALVRDVGAGRDVSYGRTHRTARATRLATLPVGYADGYPWALSNRGAQVLIRGRRVPLVGRVTMDQIVVDVGDLAGVDVGEEVVLMGRQAEGEVGCEELAQLAGTIPWEILVGIGPRVERVGRV